MNRRPSIHSDKGLKYYLIHTNVEDYKDIDDQVKYVGGDNRDFVSKESKMAKDKRGKSLVLL